MYVPLTPTFVCTPTVPGLLMSNVPLVILPLPSACTLPAIPKNPPVLVPVIKKEYMPLRLASVKPPVGRGASTLEPPQPTSTRMARDETTEKRNKPYFLDIIPLVTRILRDSRSKRSNRSEKQSGAAQNLQRRKSAMGSENQGTVPRTKRVLKYGMNPKPATLLRLFIANA